ncbi:MAG TPA: C40 family peptidase [Clostridiales bacterium]|nr:C40 family peptidase [Clostridiales bacterium]
MRTLRTLKVALCCVAGTLLLSIPTASAYADETSALEQGVAGITYTLDTYYYSVPKDEVVTAQKALSTILKTEILSPYNNLGVSTASEYVNVRKDPTTESEIVGKLYRGSAADIIEYLDGDWVKIVSGEVEGYIASNYLAIGREAEDMVEEYAKIYATVRTTTLNVRQKPTTESKILTQIPDGETYMVVKDHGEWVEILLGQDDDTGNEYTGFLAKRYNGQELIEIDVEFKVAISREEEAAIKAAQEAAERAERERLEKLAQEKAERERREAAAAKAEKERKASEADKKETSTPKPSKPSGNSSGRAQEIVTYAQKFVGNPYVWGGTSLTRGADCSGFVWRIYSDFGYGDVFKRMSSADIASSVGRKVSVSERQPGDLIFYASSSGRVNHVALYIGNDKIVHAANKNQGIITSKYNYRNVYRVRRILD